MTVLGHQSGPQNRSCVSLEQTLLLKHSGLKACGAVVIFSFYCRMCMNQCSRFYLAQKFPCREILFGLGNWTALVSSGYSEALQADAVAEANRSGLV